MATFYRWGGYASKKNRYARTAKDVNDRDRLEFLKPGGKKDNYVHRLSPAPRLLSVFDLCSGIWG